MQAFYFVDFGQMQGSVETRELTVDAAATAALRSRLRGPVGE
jgi:hypothetical protein